MKNAQLTLARPDQLDTLNNLLQLYLYDFSEFLGAGRMGLDETGRFDPGEPLDCYFNQPNHWAYLARVDGRLGGFVLVNDQVELRQGPGRNIDEFFVLRVYRRQGVGRALAFQAFDTYRGYWEVAQIHPNKPAQAFWRKVIGEYTTGRYAEHVGAHVCQTFDSSKW